MTRYEAGHLLYDIINSGIVNDEIEGGLTELAWILCHGYFEKCQEECVFRCKLDWCPHSEVPEPKEQEGDEDENKANHG